MTEPVRFNKVTKPFNEFSNSHKDKIIVKIMKAVNLAANNKPEQFFEYFMKSATGRKLILPILYEEKIKPLMKTICDHYETALQVHKTTILSMVANHFALDELISFGFPIVRNQHESARAKDKKKSRSTMPAPKPPTPTNKLPDSTLMKIIEHSLINSRKSRSKKVHNSIAEHLEVPGYNTKKNYDLNITKGDLYSSFKDIHPELKVSKSSFYKYIPPNFIAPTLPNHSTYQQPGNFLKNNLTNQTIKSPPPPRSNLNHSTLTTEPLNPPPPSNNPTYSNSVGGTMTFPPPTNIDHPTSTTDTVNSLLPSNSTYSNSANTRVYSPSQPNSYQPTGELVNPPPSNPNYLNPTSDMVNPPPSNPTYHQSTNYLQTPNDGLRFYHSSLTFDHQRPS